MNYRALSYLCLGFEPSCQSKKSSAKLKTPPLMEYNIFFVSYFLSLQNPEYNVLVCNTEQQKELSNQTLGFFGIN
ncbi:MAG: hypothetical protein J6W63_01860, partial [Treponema sp.]|nr:hypothetical protein [Treponema sp.]